MLIGILLVLSLSFSVVVSYYKAVFLKNQYNISEYIPIYLFISANTNETTRIDGRNYKIQYYNGYSDYGLEHTRGVKTYLSWTNYYKPVQLRTIQYYDYSNETHIHYVADCGRFRLDFTNFTNQITGSQFSFKQRPAEIGLYNWNTDIYEKKQDIIPATNIVANYLNKSLRYTEVFGDTDILFVSNESYIKEVIINSSPIFWNYPIDWNPNDTYLVLLTELYDFQGVELYDNDGKIDQSKIINGILQLKSTESGQEILGYLPTGKAWSKFNDGITHYTSVKNRIIFRNNNVYYASAIDYRFVKHINRTGKLFIDPTWTIGVDGEAWSNCKFYNTMENETSGYGQLYPTNTTGSIQSPVETAKLKWLRIQYQGNLHNNSVDVYWNYSHNNIDFNLELVKLNAKPNIMYWFTTPAKYGQWFFVLHGISTPFSTPEIYNITVYNDLPNENDFSYYKQIEIDSTQVSGLSNLVDFPMLLDINDSDVQNNCQADGDDIAFGNETAWLDHQIEYFNGTESNNLIAWIRIPNLNPLVNTTIYMYYGNTTMESQQNVIGVWNDDYISVYHMTDLTTSTIKDSTINGNTGTKNNPNTPLESDGFIYKSQDFSGGSDQINIDTVIAEFNTEYGTYSTWLYREFNDATYGFIFEAKYDSDNRIDSWYSTGGNWLFRHESGTGTASLSPSSNAIPLNQWIYFVMTWNVGTDELSIYINGTEITGSPDTGLGTPTAPTSFLIGDRILSGREWTGLMDETRISNISRNSDWILTEYNNQFNTSFFYFVGSEQTVSNGNGEPAEQPEPTVISSDLTISFGIVLLIALMIMMIFFYMKSRIFLIILIIFLFSLVIGYMSLMLELPFSPYIQFFFLLFQTIIFLLTTISYFEKRKGENEF